MLLTRLFSTQLYRLAGGRRFAVYSCLAYAALVLVVALRHEPWRDEADAWLAARDMTPIKLFHWLGAAGTPGLWYVLLMPLAKLGAPYEAMTLLHVAISIATAALIARRAPFPPIFRLLIIFSYYFCYEYAVIARSYALTVLLMLLVAEVLTARISRPWRLGALLFLLFNTNAFGFFFGGIITVVAAVGAVRRGDRSRAVLGGALIALAGGVLAFAQLLPPAHARPPYAGAHWAVLGDAFSQAFFPQIPAHFGFFLRHAHRWPSLAWSAYVAVRCLAAMIFLGVLLLIHGRRDALAIVVLSCAAVLYISVSKWYGGERHAGLIFALVVFGLWMSRSPQPGEQPAGQRPRTSAVGALTLLAFAASLSISCAAAAIWSYRDIRWEYSGAKAAAAFIRDNSLTSIPIAAIPAPQTEALLPYLPGTSFWYIGSQEFGTYVVWERNWGADYALTDGQIIGRVRRRFPSGPCLILTATTPLNDPENAGYHLIYHTSNYLFDENARDESYYLYARRGDAASKPTPQ